MSLVTAIGYAAFVLNVVGSLLLAHKLRFGWATRLVTNVLWAVYSYHVEGVGPMFLSAVVFFGVNLHGWRTWSGPTC